MPELDLAKSFDRIKRMVTEKSIAYGTENGLGNDAEYPLALGYAALAVRTLGAALDPKVLLGKAGRRTLEVGFDSGDSMVVATLSA